MSERPREPSPVLAPLDLEVAGLRVRKDPHPVPAPLAGAVAPAASSRACHRSIPLDSMDCTICAFETSRRAGPSSRVAELFGASGILTENGPETRPYTGLPELHDAREACIQSSPATPTIVQDGGVHWGENVTFHEGQVPSHRREHPSHREPLTSHVPCPPFLMSPCRTMEPMGEPILASADRERLSNRTSVRHGLACR